VETVLHVGLSNALAALVLAPAAAGIGWFCRRPALTHGLWLLVLLKLVTPPLWPVPVPWPAGTTPVKAVSPVALSLEAVPSDPEDRPPDRADEALVVPVARAAPAASPFPWQWLVAVTWLTGSSLWAALTGWRSSRFHRLLRLAQPASASLQDRARCLAEQLGLKRCPAVVFVSGPVAPLLWAVGRARLLLPADLWPRLTDEQRDTLLVHELAHLRRRDHWVRHLDLVVLALYWWHPVVWWARRELQEAEELCCDAWVVWALPAGGPAYAEALVETVTFLSRPRLALPVGASGMGQTYYLKRRLTMIMRGTMPRALSRLGLLAVLGIGAVLLPLAPSWGRQPSPHDSPSPATEDEPADPKPQPPRLPSPPPKKAKAIPLSDEAREELELLQAQLDGKRAELQEAKARLTPAKLEIERLNRLKGNGVVSDTELARARSELDVLKAGVAAKEAQVREAEIRLRQARRRLDLSVPPAVAVPARPAATGRLKELEKKLDDLRKEMEELRKELHPAPPNIRTYQSETRRFRLPMQVEPERKKDIKALLLFVSSDQGKTWTQHAEATPDQDAFTFVAPRDGLYWFIVCTVDAQGRRSPADLHQAAPGLQVLVDTTKDVPKQTDDKQVRVGQIIIKGNVRTEQEVILKAVPLFPGQVLSYAELRAAERNLERLNLFEVNPKTGIRPKITVVDADGDSRYKDIVIEVKEKESGKQ
jgi:beta-lactamase regulating signal transducer with metallopeptidase domain